MRIRSLLIILAAIALGLWWFLSPPPSNSEQGEEIQAKETVAPADDLAAGKVEREEVVLPGDDELADVDSSPTVEADAERKLGKVVIHFVRTPSEESMIHFPFHIEWNSRIRGGPSGRLTGVTDSAGTWAMEIPAGSYWGGLQESNDGEERGIRYQFELESFAGETTQITYYFAEEYTMDLTLQYPGGQPIANHEISIRQSVSRDRRTFSSRDSGITDEQGNLKVAMVDGELEVLAEGLKSGFYPTSWEIQTSQELEGSSQTLVALRAKELLVTVLDKADQPVSEAAIGQNWSRERGDVVRRAGVNRAGDQISDAQGQAQLLIPSLEEIYLQVRHEDYGPVDITVPRGQNTLIVKMNSGARISGIVLDEDGLPIPEADVHAYAPNDAWASSPDSLSGGDWKSVKTDAEGKFHFVGLGTEAMQSVLATKVGYAAVFQTWKPKEESHVELVLKPEQPLFGFFLDEMDQPIAGASIRIYGEPYSEREPAWNNISYLLNENRQITDEHGGFTFSNLHMGEYLLKASASGSSRDSAFIEAIPGPDPIILRPGDLAPGYVAIRFQVTDERSNPLAAKANRGYFSIRKEGGGGTPGRLVGTADQNGFGRSEPFDRSVPPMGMRVPAGGEIIDFISINQDGFVPEIIAVPDLRDGWNDKTVALQPAGQQDFVLVFGEIAVPKDSRLKVALTLTSRLGLQTSGTVYLVPDFATTLALEPLSKEHSFAFTAWPKAGGELFIWGKQNEGPVKAFVPYSEGTYQIHLSEDQMRILKLIE